MLGMGDFYYELSVRVVEFCMAHRESTGGLIPLSKISKGLKEDGEDIQTALNKLQKLGSGYQNKMNMPGASYLPDSGVIITDTHG